MAFNPFEQLRFVVAEPRQAFEEVAATLLVDCRLGEGRVKIHRGDGGVDVYHGTWGASGSLEVFQIKYFLSPWGESQRSQIRNSFGTARDSKEYRLSKWYLCVPDRPTKEDLRWFDTWGRDLPVNLLDSDDLINMLERPEGTKARGMMRNWGVVGLGADGPVVKAWLRADSRAERSGLTHTLHVILANGGTCSAENLRVAIHHSEPGCVSDRHDDRHWRDVANGPLNPRILELRSTLHPGERIAALSIPIVVSTPFPFTICIKTWVKDGTPSEEHLILQKGGLLGNELLPFSRGSIDIHVGLHPEPASRHLEYPTETGETLLTLMAKHPQPEEFGITHILSGDPSDPEKALFLPSLARAGQPWGMSKQMFQEELNALIRLGWLEAGSTTTNQACYRLSMPGRADARFNALVELAVSEQQR